MKNYLKKLAKKSLSLFMAVMMLMSAWVWVAPVPEAHAAVETLNYTIDELYSTYLTEDSGATFVKGKFTHDNTVPAQDGLYVNVLYSPAYTQTDIYSGVASGSSKLSVDGCNSGNYNSMDVDWHHSEAVMLYDGVTQPRTGVMLTTDPNKGGSWDGNSTVHRAWMTNDNLAHPNYWYGICGANLDFTWAMTQSAQLNYLSTNSDDSKVITRKNSETVPCYANYMQFTGSMDDSEFLLEIYPKFSLYVKDSDTPATISATSDKCIRIVNYKTLKETIAKAKAYIKTNIKDKSDYASIYSASSIEELRKLANALVAAKPDKTYFNGDSKHDYNGYATDAKAAVTAWNNWITAGGLQPKEYTITIQKADGTSTTASTYYGEVVDLQAKVQGIANSIISVDDNNHNLYVWDVLDENGKAIKHTTTGDFTINEKLDKTVAHAKQYKDAQDGKNHEVWCDICRYGVDETESELHTKGTFDKYVEGKAPDCGHAGVGIYNCAHCTAKIEAPVDPQGAHTPDIDLANENYIIVSTKNPSCTSTGYTEVEFYCTVCGLLSGKTEKITIAATGHSMVDVVTPPTCTERGYITSTCSVCGEKKTTYSSELAALGHIEVVDEAVAPTCTDTGLTEGKHCERCGTVIVKQKEIEKLPHTYGEPARENYKPATCREDGYYDMVVRCTVCGTIDETKTEHFVLPQGSCNYVYTQLPDGVHHIGICSACGGEDKVNTVCSGGEATCVLKAVCKDCHTAYGSFNSTNHKAVETVSEKAPTCQLEGYKAHLYCNDCKKVVDENGNETSKEIIPKVAHKYGVWVSNGKGADGKYTHTQTCTTCVEANGEILTVTEECRGGTPTCTTQAVCDDCKTGYGDLLPHEYTEKVVHSSYLASEATCTAKATYYYSCKCTASSKGDTNTTFEDGDFLPHKFEVANPIEKYLATPATCTTPAKYYYSCACDSSDEAYMSQLKTTFRSGEPAAHDYIELQKETYAETPATCSDGGKYYKSCSVCGNSSKDDVKFPEGEEKLFVGQKLSHVNRVERVITKAPGCNTQGEYYTKETCARCGVSVENTTDVKYIPATGKHSYGEWVVTQATCKDAGERVRTCTSCEGDNKAVIREVIPATGEHTYATDGEGNIIWTPDTNNVASCLKEGKAYAACTNVIGKDDAGNDIICGAKIYSTIDPVDHNWIAPEVTTDDEGNETVNFHNDRLKAPATCVSKAVYYKHCATCGMTLDETYDWGEFDLVNGHNFGGELKYDAEKAENYYECLNEGCNERSSIPCVFIEITDGISKEEAIALGAVIVTEPDCHTKGTAEVYCQTCGEKHKKTVEIAIDPTKHMSDETITIGALDATCSTDGSTGTKYYACCYSDAEGADNSAFVVEEAEVIPADKTLYAHENIITVDGEAATCTTPGYESYQKCDKCDTVIGEIVEIPATDHAFTSWTQVEGEEKHIRTCQNDGCTVTETADCESDGTANCVEKAKCKVCGGECGDVDADNHKALKIMPEKAPTCQVKGLEAYEYCEACTYNQKDSAKEIDITDHVYPETWTQVVTEDENGAKVYNHTKICINCVEDAANNLTKSVLTEACESDGTANCKQAAKCKVCGGTYGEADPSVHASVETKVVGATDATCTATGYTGDTVYICCEAVKQQGTEIPEAAHKYTVELTETKVEATCKTKGSVDYKCENCEATEPRELPLDSKNHESTVELTIGAKEATCTSAGYTGNKYHFCCYDINKTEAQNKKALIAMGKVIDTVGSHKYSNPVPEYMIASITETEGEDGKVTKTITYKTEEPTYEEKVAARRDGNWYHVQQCTECGDILTKACATSDHTYNCVETSVCDICSGLCSLIDEDNHKDELKIVRGKAATCVADGTKDYYKCEACNKTYLDKAGKSIIDITTDEGKAAIKIDMSTAKHLVIWTKPDVVVPGDCGTSGYEIYKCKVEGCTYEAKLDTGIVATSHTWNATPEGEDVYSLITEPTCGKNGYKAIRCTVCQAIKLNSYVIVPATGEHTYGEPVVEPGTSCTDPGKIIRTCTACGYKDIQKDETGNSAHVWTVEENDGWYVTGGNCLEGVSIERRCQNCDYYETSTASGNHDFVDYERVEPTPESDGYVIYECKNCKFRTDKEVLKYEGNTPDTPEVHKHKINYDDYKLISEATCESAEIREYTCTECLEKVRLPYGEIEPHVWLPQNAAVATCEKDGHNEYYRCVRCLKEYGKVVIPATGHHDGDGNGKCDRCNAAFYDGDNGQSACTCMCHKSGFMGFIYKIARFFWKLFKTNPSCACGNKHY